MTTADDSIQLYANIELHCADDDPTSVSPMIDRIRPADARHTQEACVRTKSRLSRSLADVSCSAVPQTIIAPKPSRSLPSCVKFSQKTHSDCETPLIFTAETIEKTIGDLLGDNDLFQRQYQNQHCSFRFKRDDRHRRKPVSKIRSYTRPSHADGRYDRQAHRFHPSHPQQPCLSKTTPGPSQFSNNAIPWPTYPSYYYPNVPSYCSCSMLTYDPSYCTSTQYAYPDPRYSEMSYLTAEPRPYRPV